MWFRAIKTGTHKGLPLQSVIDYKFVSQPYHHLIRHSLTAMGVAPARIANRLRSEREKILTKYYIRLM